MKRAIKVVLGTMATLGLVATMSGGLQADDYLYEADYYMDGNRAVYLSCLSELCPAEIPYCCNGEGGISW